MDPLSASCFNLNCDNLKESRDKTNAKYNEILGSCISITKYEQRTFKTLIPQFIATLIASSYHVVLGITLAYSAILLPQITEKKDIPMTDTEGSWIASMAPLVAPVGTIIAGFLMDKYGRLNTLKIAAIPGIAGYAVIALAQSVPMILLGRILTSISSALGTGPAVVYITEIARVDLRGSLIAVCPALASLGMVITFLKGWFLTWREVAWSGIGYNIIPCILIFFIPESPSWLVSQDRLEEARQSLYWLNKYQPETEFNNRNVANLKMSLLQKEHELKMIEASRKPNKGIFDNLNGFLKPTGYKPLAILSGVFFFQQFSGIFIFLFYSISFFRGVGSTFNPYIASIFIGVVRFVMSLANTYLLSHFRRRPMMLLSSIGMCASILFSAFFTKWIQDGSVTQTWIPVVFLLLFVLTSMIGVVPIPFTMTAELFPLEIRGVAHSITLAMANFFMFFALQTYPFFLDILEGMVGVQYFFAVMILIGFVFIYVFLPETYNKKLSDIEEYFKSNTIFLSYKNKKEESTNQIKTSSNLTKKNRKPNIVKFDNETLLEEA